MGKHSLLSPSAGDRWLNCTKSVRAFEHIPRKTNKYAEEGTCAHEVLERMILNIPLDKTTELMKKYYSSDMYRTILGVYQSIKAEEGIIMPERTYEIPEIQGFGTVDVTLIKDNMIGIMDLKYGKTKVRAFKNTQLMLYAWGAYCAANKIFDPHKTITLEILQPRIDHFDVWATDIGHIKEWIENIVTPKAQLALAGKGEWAEGRWCYFCPGRDQCNHLKVSNAKKEFDDDYVFEEEDI